MTCLTPPCKKTTLGFGSSTPRSKQISAGIPFIKSKSITKAISPKFSTTERLKNRRQQVSRMMPQKTQLQLESELLKQWFSDAFLEKLEQDPYTASKYDKNHPLLSIEEFKTLVLEKNLRRVCSEKKVREVIQHENYKISVPVLRQVLRVHKAMFELKDQNKTVVLRASPGTEVANSKTKYSCVLFDAL